MKAQLRDELKARFAQAQDKESWTRDLVEHLYQFLKSQSGDWCVYQALDSEISLANLLPRLPKIVWVYPKVIGGGLHFFEPKRGFEKAYAGIMEPVLTEAREISIQEVTGILVPGLGFDSKGVRLGKGKGYYDKALQNYQGITVGVSFSSLIVDELPADPWDVRVQWIATEKGLKKAVV